MNEAQPTPGGRPVGVAHDGAKGFEAGTESAVFHAVGAPFAV
ncbi:MAG: hypothetical protein ACLPSW_15335 [Roseiarcus sp.]